MEIVKKVFLTFTFFYQFSYAQSIAPKLPLLDSLTHKIETKSYPNIHAVLISQNGVTVYQKYANGYSPDSLHDSRSSFKSIASLLTGIAIDKGFIKNTAQKVYPFFPEYASFQHWDSQKAQMTLDNLLSMKTGFDCEEFNGTNDCEEAMTQSKDWVKFSLDLPLTKHPGTYWSYTSSAPMILSGVIANASKMSIVAFADKYLFKPLGINKYRWTMDSAQHGMTAGSFFIRPADMLKIGQLVANQGKWQGKQIVSKEWLDKSTRADTAIPNFSFVGSSRTKRAQPQPTYYGYYWYRERLVTDSFRHEVLFASGNGGQYIMLINDLHLVVVFTGGNYNSWKAKLPFNALTTYIIPSFATSSQPSR
ncbi:serine hydrolase domain-containing protein [Spirosoma horti]